MKNWKNTAKKLLFPSIWLMLVLTVISAAGLAIYRIVRATREIRKVRGKE